MINDRGKDFVYDLIDYFITDLCSFFNPVRNMNSKQIAQTTALIIELYEHYKIEDFILCFKNIKALKYGKLFEGIDGGKIIDMIHQYDQEREEDIENFHKKRSQEQKQLSKEQYNEAILPVLKKVVENIDANKKVVDVPKVRERNENEKRFDNWMKQFDTIQNRQHHTLGGIRFIKRYGKMMNINTFLEYKLDQYNKYAKH